MITKELNQTDLLQVLRDKGLTERRPDIANLILQGYTRFETNGTTYALHGSRAANVTREAPATLTRADSTPTTASRLTDDEADKRIEEFERAHQAGISKAQPVQYEQPAPAPHVGRANAADALLTILHHNIAREERAERPQEYDLGPFAHLFDGPEEAA